MPGSIAQGATNTSIAYTPEHSRGSIATGGVPMYYLNNPAGGVSEELVAGSSQSWHTYLAAYGRTVAELETANGTTTAYYFVGDRLGSTRALVQSNGSEEEYDSGACPPAALCADRGDAWGKRRYASGVDAPGCSSTRPRSATTRGYTGQEMLDTYCLVNLNARIYDPTLGRFPSADPTIPDAADGQSYNRYSYVVNNPLTLTDPSGFTPESMICDVDTKGHEKCFYEGGSGVDGTLYGTGGWYGGGGFSGQSGGGGWGWIGSLDTIAPDGTDMGTWNQFEYFPGSDVSPGGTGGTPDDGVGGGGNLNTDSSISRDSKRPHDSTRSTVCYGTGRGLAGNLAMVGRQGGIPGQTVQAGTAAVIPQQFGFDTGAEMGQYADDISGTIGDAAFSSVTDVIGGKSPIPGMNVRSALQLDFPDELIIEIPGASDQGANAPVSITVPPGMSCPTGTSAAGEG